MMTIFNIVLFVVTFITAALAIAKFRYEEGYSKYSPYYQEKHKSTEA